MKSLVLLCLLGLLVAPAVAAPADQLWFTGKRGPTDAFGQGVGAVHLAWGVTEGALPADLTQFEVLLDGERIYTTDAHPRPTAAAVEAAYARSPRQRQLAAARAQRAGDAGPLGQVIAPKIGGAAPADRHWRREAGRLDPIVAQLSGRGLILPDGAPGEYTLNAVSADRRRALLGTVVIGRTGRTAQAPANPRQVIGLGRCDAPESGRQHGVIALDWDLPGARGSVDRLSYTLDLAGFDVFRATDSGVVDANLDFAALAAASAAGPDGEPVIDGFVRINGAPIAPSPATAGGTEARYQAWNPESAQWVQTAEDVARAGLKPGDVRAHYIVARDRTGNYGDAVGVRVTVPDTLAPPAPAAIRAQPVGATRDAAMKLSWWHIDPRNLHDAYPGRPWCNLPTAAQDGRLTWAGADADCVTPTHQVNTDVVAYRIFRFDDQVTAARFTDTDGDGYADAAERIAVGPNLTRPGTACDAARNPGGPSALVAEVTRIDRRDGRAVVEFSDPLANGLERDRVYWYRVAAVGRNGQISVLSRPVRALIPNLEKPDRVQPGELTVSQCSLDARPEAPSGAHAVDETTYATEARFYCIVQDGLRPSFGGVRGEPIFARRLVHTAPIVPLPDGRRGTTDDTVCASLLPDCELVVEFVDAAGQTLGATPVPDYQDPRGGACDFTAVLEPNCAERVPVEGSPRGPIFVELEGDDCIDLFRTVNGRRYRMRTLCPNRFLWVGEAVPLDSSIACFSAKRVNANGVSSTVTPLGCYRPVDRTPPDPPQLTAMRFGDDAATVEWRSPAQTTGGVLLEWRQADGSRFGTSFASHQGRFGPFEAHQYAFAVPPLGDVGQRWCVRGRAFGRGAGATGMTSDWSPELCVERRPPEEPLPVYLEWPTIARPPNLGTLPVRYIEPDNVPVIALSDIDDAVFDEGECGVPFDDILPEASRPVCDGERDCMTPFARMFTGCDFCSRVDARLGANKRFVVYRQIRHADGRIDPYVQVSQRVDGMFCEASCGDVFGCQCPNDDCSGFEDPFAVDPYGFCAFPALAQFICNPENHNGVQLPPPQGVFDPYIKLLTFPEGDAWARRTLAFVDRTPHVAGAEYRYQLVYFDTRGEIIGRRTTDFFQTPEVEAL